jgi:hypothetical protein
VDEVSALSRPGRSLPGQNKEPIVKTLVVHYGGLDSATSRCDICVKRYHAFHLSSIDDPGIYNDADYRREAHRANLAEHPA